MNVTIKLDREEDGRWIAQAIGLPGVMCYRQTRDEAIRRAERLAMEVIAGRIVHGEHPSSSLGVSFAISDEQLARQQSEARPRCIGEDRAASEAPAWPDYEFTFHEQDEIGPRILARVARRTGLSPEDL